MMGKASSLAKKRSAANTTPESKVKSPLSARKARKGGKKNSKRKDCFQATISRLTRQFKEEGEESIEEFEEDNSDADSDEGPAATAGMQKQPLSQQKALQSDPTWRIVPKCQGGQGVRAWVNQARPQGGAEKRLNRNSEYYYDPKRRHVYDTNIVEERNVEKLVALGHDETRVRGALRKNDGKLELAYFELRADANKRDADLSSASTTSLSDDDVCERTEKVPSVAAAAAAAAPSVSVATAPAPPSAEQPHHNAHSIPHSVQPRRPMRLARSQYTAHQVHLGCSTQAFIRREQNSGIAELFRIYPQLARCAQLLASDEDTDSD